jgi:two-component system nitrate/nitrite response regulator NarL
MAQATKPDVILMDVNMPHLNGLEAVKLLQQKLPQIAVVMLTVAEDDDTLFEAIKHGARGYLLKNLEPQELYGMLDKVRHGEAALSGAMASKVLREFMDPYYNEAKQRAKVDELTPREVMVLEEVVTGANNRAIADLLDITENTVKIHLRNILEKLQVRNRTQAAVQAVREGLVNDPPQ